MLLAFVFVNKFSSVEMRTMDCQGTRARVEVVDCKDEMVVVGVGKVVDGSEIFRGRIYRTWTLMLRGTEVVQ